jgi:hypothetical protein
MPISVICPSCYRAIRVPDGFAGRGICPDCRVGVPIPDDDSYQSDQLDDDDYPRRPRRPGPCRLDHLRAWRRVATGLLVQQAAVVLLLLGLGLVVAATIALADDPGNLQDEPNPAQMVTGCLGLLALFLGLAVQAVGRFMSAGTTVRAPRIAGFLAAITSVVVLFGYCLVGVVAIAMQMEQEQGNVPGDEATMALGLMFVAWLLLAAAGETCHALSIGSVGRVLRADGARLLGRALAVCIPIAGALGLAGLCALGVWAEANNPNGGPNPAEDTVSLWCFAGLSAAIGFYLLLDLVLLHQGRAAVGRLASDADRADFDGRWD